MKKIEIRERKREDVTEFCEFLSKLDSEAEFMLFEKGEKNINEEDILKKIDDISDSSDICNIAKIENTIIGYAVAVRENFIRTKHVADIVIGVLEDYCGKGIGTLFFQNILNWANDNEVKRLELTVIAENKRAINLYKKFGFKVEGIREKATLKDGEYYDELYMAKIID